MRHTSAHIFLIALAALTAPSCKDSDEPASNLPQAVCYDFVTLEESSEQGSVFTMRKNGDSPLISYYSEIDFSRIQTVKDGDRVILCYLRTDGEVYTSGPIDIFGYVQLSSTEQRMFTGPAADYDGWQCPPMKVNALWRTGTFINLDTEISVYQARKPKVLVLVADSATLASDTPELHVYYENADGNDGANPYRVYASFDISELWDLSGCRGVKVTYPAAGGFESMTFDK